MGNGFSTGIFLIRNATSAAKGDASRVPVVLAQTGTLIEKVAKYDNALGRGATSAVKAIDTLTKSDYATKVVGLSSKLVTPLLVLGGGIRVLQSDDKEKALYKEAAGIGTMLAAEKIYKTINKKYLTKLIDNTNNKYVKTAAAILSALGFVATSIGSYSVGSKVGESLATDKTKNPDENPNIEAKKIETLA